MAENQNVTSSRDKLFERAAARFPDRRYKGYAAQNADGAQEGTDELEDSIIEMLDEDKASLDEMNAKNAKLYELLYSDPDAAEVIQRWAETGDPRTALIETFGYDFVEASKSEDGMAKFKDSLSSWRERSAREKEIREKAEANWEASKAACVEWGEEKGLTVDQTDKKYIQMIHLRGAHAPYSADANGNYNASVGRNENIAGYMHMVDDYIQRMKALGLYDDATIIITADHGDKGTNMQVVYWIKQAGEHHDSIPVTAAPISHDDFPGTILSLIGADYPYGKSIFDWHDGDVRQRSCSVVDRDTSLYPLVTSFSDLELGAHNMWKTYTYTGDGQELMRIQKRGAYTREALAQSFN